MRKGIKGGGNNKEYLLTLELCRVKLLPFISTAVWRRPGIASLPSCNVIITCLGYSECSQSY